MPDQTALPLANAMDRVTPQVQSVRDDCDDLAALGLDVPPEIPPLLAALDHLSTLVHRPPLRVDHIDAAVRAGDLDAIERSLLTYSSWASTEQRYRSEAYGRVAPGILATAAKALDEAAPGHLAVVASRYNEAAASLTACAALVDIGASAESIVGIDRKHQAAWMDAAGHVATLENLLGPLLRLANRCGRWFTVYGPDVLEPRVLAAAADVTGIDGEAVLDAWETGAHRLGRFGAVVSVGARIRALVEPADWTALADQVPKRPEYTVTHVPAGMGRVPVRHRVGTPAVLPA